MPLGGPLDHAKDPSANCAYAVEGAPQTHERIGFLALIAVPSILVWAA